MNLCRTPHKGVDEGIGDVTEHRADHLIEYLAGKIVVQSKLDLAGILCQRPEVPGTLEAAKRAIAKEDFHRMWMLLVILGRK